MKQLISRIRTWQPKPYIGWTFDDERVSWWFYKLYDKNYPDGPVIRNILGRFWLWLWKL